MKDLELLVAKNPIGVEANNPNGTKGGKMTKSDFDKGGPKMGDNGPDQEKGPRRQCQGEHRYAGSASGKSRNTRQKPAR